MEAVNRYYPDLNETQRRQFEALGALYTDWNAKINVISRRDIENLYLHHVLHSLSIERMILFPEVTFHLVDSVRKKIRVAQAVAEALELRNVTTCHERVEDERGRFDFVVSRAVMPLRDLAAAVRKNIREEQQNALPNGLICLKGGELQHEIAPFKKQAVRLDIDAYFREPYFKTKQIVYIPL